MASMVLRGTKYSVVYYEGEGADRHQVWKSGLSYDEADALRKKKNEEEEKRKEAAKAQRTKESASSRVTVEEFLDDFKKSYGLKHWGESYYESNMALFNNYIYPYFGYHRLSEVTTKKIDDYYNFLMSECEPVCNTGKPKREHVTASQVNEIHKVLRTAFNQARRWKLIPENPFVDADVPEYKAKERPAFSPDELEEILTYTDCPDDYSRYVFHVALCIQYYCTTRGGEVGALQWPDYHRDAKTIHIYKAIGRVKRKNLHLPKLKIYYTFPLLNSNASTVIVLKQPKTEKTERMSKINSILIDKLERLRSMQQSLIHEIYGDYYPDSQLIICQANGRPLLPEQLNRRFKEVIQDMITDGHRFKSVPESNLDDVVFHSVRAASATKKLALTGGNIKAVMAAGGWAEPDMVIRYSKTYDQDQIDIAEQMEQEYQDSSVADDSNASKQREVLMQLIAERPDLVKELLATVAK